MTIWSWVQFSSVAQLCPTLFNPMDCIAHPGACSNSCPLSQWCHPSISSSVILFSSCPQSLPASESLQMSLFFPSGGQSIGVSASTSVLPMNTQDWSLGWTGWISLQSKGLLRIFSNTTVKSCSNVVSSKKLLQTPLEKESSLLLTLLLSSTATLITNILFNYFYVIRW